MRLRKFNESTNNNKQKFIDAIQTLFHSWGCDTPPEVYWGCNELLDWYEIEFGVTLGVRFDEENENYEEVIESIKNN